MRKEICISPFVPCHHRLCSLLEQVAVVPRHRDGLSGRAASFVVVIDCVVVGRDFADRGWDEESPPVGTVLKYLELAEGSRSRAVAVVERSSSGRRRSAADAFLSIRGRRQNRLLLELDLAEGKSRDPLASATGSS
jgi:hypothetical protein